MTAHHRREGHLARETTMREVMTPAPHAIASDASVAAARAVMDEHRIRHLPVVRAGAVVGLLSERDVAVSSAGTVAEAMTPFVYTTSPDARLRDVARVMAAEKYGCAVVLDGAAVQGIFTTTDALRHLVAILG